MSLLPSWLRPRPRLAPGQRAALERYRRLDAAGADQQLDSARFVVVDVETSGLNPFQDRLIAIGAVGVTDGLLRLGDTFEVVLRQDAPSCSDNILVHGIDGTTQRAGAEPVPALLAFLDYAGKCPLVGFHADFDRIMIERAIRSALGIKPANPWLDLAYLAPALLRGRAEKARSLDEWTQAFGLENPARHNAVADALVTAQLFQILLVEAKRQDISTCGGLARVAEGQRWLSRA
jgi:DNA polymerase-3 subunit epsilon